MTGAWDSKENTAAFFKAMQEGDNARVLEMIGMPGNRFLSTYMSNYDEHTPLIFAAYHGRNELVRHLIAKGAPVDMPCGRHRGTALVVAVDQAYYEIAEMLLDAGANPNAVNTEGRSALHIAAQSRQKKTVRFLLSRGADPELQDGKGKTPLSEARMRDLDEIVTLMEEKTAATRRRREIAETVDVLCSKGTQRDIPLLPPCPFKKPGPRP